MDKFVCPTLVLSLFLAFGCSNNYSDEPRLKTSSPQVLSESFMVMLKSLESSENVTPEEFVNILDRMTENVLADDGTKLEKGWFTSALKDIHRGKSISDVYERHINSFWSFFSGKTADDIVLFFNESLYTVPITTTYEYLGDGEWVKKKIVYRPTKTGANISFTDEDSRKIQKVGKAVKSLFD